MEQSEISILKQELELLKERIAVMERQEKARSIAASVVDLLPESSPKANAYLIKQLEEGYVIKELEISEKARRQMS